MMTLPGRRLVSCETSVIEVRRILISLYRDGGVDDGISELGVDIRMALLILNRPSPRGHCVGTAETARLSHAS
jgi:hypothetical protein